MALSANTPVQWLAGSENVLVSRTIKTAKKIYEGAIITQIKATTGNPAEPATNDGAANVFLGIAMAEALTGNGTRTIQCRATGVVRLAVEATVTKGLINTLVYAKDDGSVGTATTLGPSVGTVFELSDAGYAWIRLRSTLMTANT